MIWGRIPKGHVWKIYKKNIRHTHTHMECISIYKGLIYSLWCNGDRCNLIRCHPHSSGVRFWTQRRTKMSGIRLLTGRRDTHLSGILNLGSLCMHAQYTRHVLRTYVCIWDAVVVVDGFILISKQFNRFRFYILGPPSSPSLFLLVGFSASSCGMRPSFVRRCSWSRETF